ncbi:MAG: aminotransferase class I/II-fold pyridoxal phosphate-dependent enzyme [Bacteroidetes bacterium]|nr:aminotransferase class I/II-fold pyridoxal phosphate-dependent enzyme [Bacteroidota bacterium]
MREVNLQSKLPGIGTSIFTVMSKMAVDYNAINLAQGFPDFNCSDELIELVNHYQKKGYNQYAPMGGVQKLREQISKKIEKLYGRKYDVENEITVTAGATQAIYTAITTVVQTGDEVIIIEPAYDSYVPGVKASGGIPIYVKLNPEDYSYNWEAIRNSISDKTKLIIINSPHNPTGSLITEDDIKQLEALIKNTNIFTISDEVYEHIIFDGEKHISLAESDELAKRSFVISSFGKTFHTTGWKMGYCAAPDNLMKEFRKMHQFIVFSANTPIQYAYADYLQDETHYNSLGDFYGKKRDTFRARIKNSNFKLMPCSGTYFQLLDYSDVSKLNDMKFSEYLAKEKKIAAIPNSPFYDRGDTNKIIRICFAKRDEVLLKAADILSRI